jgi:Rad3-related DNA helicase
MNFIPEKDYEGLLKQAKAMHRIIEAMEKSKSIQGKAVDDLTRQLLLCNHSHLESEREINAILTDQVLQLEKERDELGSECEKLAETLFQVAEMLNIDYESARKDPRKPSDVYRDYLDMHDAEVIENLIKELTDADGGFSLKGREWLQGYADGLRQKH